MTPHGAFIQTGFATILDAITLLVRDATERASMEERGSGGEGGKMKREGRRR